MTEEIIAEKNGIEIVKLTCEGREDSYCICGESITTSHYNEYQWETLKSMFRTFLGDKE